MMRLSKSSVLVYLALLWHVTLGSPNNRDTSSSTQLEGMDSSEEVNLTSSAVLSNGRGRPDIFYGDLSPQKEMAQKLAPDITNPIQPAISFVQRRQVTRQSSGGNLLPLPEEPSFPADSSRSATTFENNDRNVAGVTPRIPESAARIPESAARIPEPAGSFGSSVSTMISENVQPSGHTNRRTQSQPSNINPSRCSSTTQNCFPVVIVQPDQNNGNSPPVTFFHQSNPQSGLNIPVASGGVEPPVNFVPRTQLFVPENVRGFDQINPANTQSAQESSNGRGSSNASPPRNTNTNFGSTGTSASGRLPNPSQNTNNNFGSTGSANSGGSSSINPFQNTNNNFGSSTGSFDGGSSQQPSQGRVDLPAKGVSTNNNRFPGSGPTNQYPIHDENKFGGGRTYPEIVPLVNGILVFTLDLLKTFRRGSQSNVVYSPVSISSLLSLLTLATNGNSKHEIEDAIFPFISSSSYDQHGQFETILERLNHLSQGITISTSSRLFLEQSVEVSGTFTDGAMKHYNCSVSLENFSGKPEQTMKRVNSWIDEETRGKITQFISEPFRPDTKFVAANTIYFDGKWATPFSEQDTSERDFDTGNEVIQIPMMTNIIETPHYYSKELNVDVTSLPYSGGEFAMIIILPRESPTGKSIMDLEKQLNSRIIESLVNNLSSKTVSISLPRMKLAMKTSLVQNLSELRIRSIFSPSTANFSSMTNTKPLWVGEFLHEAVMEVTEEGTVAAAVSGVFLNRMGGYQYINVNKPAIIFIRDMVTRVPLFWTRLVKPEPVPESGQKRAKSPAKF